MNQRLHEHLAFLYGKEQADALLPRLDFMLGQFQERHGDSLPSSPNGRFNEKDAILITYGNMVQEKGAPPLRTLAAFLEKWLAGVVRGVHLLPFYPYSSDDGFSVIDYKQVNPDFGRWKEIGRIGQHFRLMFDAVINHISRESDWFRRFLRHDPQYRNYFTVVEPGTDLSQVFRPRALPLLTEVETAVGKKHVWTTFSDDQIDLNYASPDLLLDVIDVLLFYVAHGAEFIRLDAIAFMWKKIGTSSIHLPQTHRIIQLMRTVLDIVAPYVVLITETNVPHEDNISYFGDGTNEAQMVYNFSLPPLTLHAFHTGNAETLSQWASTLTLPSKQASFFNFLASHDGIGVTPARGILSDEAIAAMAARVKALGGYVSYKNNPDGSQSAYELNINYLEALRDPEAEEEIALEAKRFLASQAIVLALRGVPGIYFHSLFGSRNWQTGVEQTGRYRTINRQKLQRQQLESELSDSGSLRHRVFYGYRNLLKQRTTVAAFHPTGEQKVLSCHEAVFAVWRATTDGRSQVLCLQNVSNQSHRLAIDLNTLPQPPGDELQDLVGGQSFATKDKQQLQIEIAPYQVLWLHSDDTP